MAGSRQERPYKAKQDCTAMRRSYLARGTGCVELWSRKRRRMRCLRMTGKLLLSCILTALLQPAAGFKPTAIKQDGVLSIGGRRDAAAATAPSRRMDHRRRCETSTAARGGRRRLPSTLGVGTEAGEAHNEHVNGYDNANEGWMRSSLSPLQTTSATATTTNNNNINSGGPGDHAVGDGTSHDYYHEGDWQDSSRQSEEAEVPQRGIVAATDESMAAAARQSVPLKVMVFIDGTWLYYSFFGRGSRCHVSAKLGPGWQYDYRVKWEMLPVIISRALHEQMAANGTPPRLVEVVRSVVFSSARKDTEKDSSRLQMFKSMREKNFEVHMATTMGVQEKCIDIALAVEMMHYATIPDSYDVGVLVTGDKDFMPVMSRTRQKGRRVCLCTMRNSCNTDLLRDDAHVVDFQPVWINEHLDDMMEYAPRINMGMGFRPSRVPPETLCDIIVTLIEDNGGTFPSRDLGRKLLAIPVLEDGTTALAIIKESWGSLTKFLLDQSDVLQMSKQQVDPADPTIRRFTVSLVDQQNSMKSVKLGEVRDDDSLEDESTMSHESDFESGDEVEESWESAGGEDGVEGKRETAESLSSRRVLELRDLLRERRLPIYGKKSVLVDRLLVAMEAEATAASTASARPSTEPRDDNTLHYQQQQQAGESSSQFDPRGGARAPTMPVENGGFDIAAAEVNAGDWSPGGRSNKFDLKTIGDQRKTLHATLLSLVHKVIDEEEATNGGVIVSSRDIGRGLSRMDAPDGSGRTALACLKGRYQSLMSFLRACNDDFVIESIGGHGDFVVFGVRRPSPGGRGSGRNGGRGDGAWRTGEDRRSGSGNMGAGENGGSLSMRDSWSARESDENRGGGWGGW